jgi:hypothetical protein
VYIKRWLGIAILSCVALAPSGVNTQAPQAKRLTAADAKDHIGEQATVCGKVASSRYAATTRGKPTFLNLDKPYPYAGHLIYSAFKASLLPYGAGTVTVFDNSVIWPVEHNTLPSTTERVPNEFEA